VVLQVAKRLNRQRNLWSWREELNHPTVAGSARNLASRLLRRGPVPAGSPSRRRPQT
jgi:hypothetical protein